MSLIIAVLYLCSQLPKEESSKKKTVLDIEPSKKY
jgi:hypothetical protein